MAGLLKLIATASVLAACLSLHACEREGAFSGGAASTAGNLASGPEAGADPVTRGHFLVRTHGCIGCHTPQIPGPNGPQPDMTRYLSGHPEGVFLELPDPMPPKPWVGVVNETRTAFGGDYGITYAINLTPDVNTGLGIWTEEMFIAAIRTGKHMGISRPIMPPMPWMNFRWMDDADLKAIYAYLRSIPPISNRVPDYQPPAGSEEPFVESEM